MVVVGSQEWVGSVLTLRMDTSADGKDGNYFHVSIQFIFIPQIRKLFIIYFYAPLWSRPYINYFLSNSMSSFHTLF